MLLPSKEGQTHLLIPYFQHELWHLGVKVFHDDNWITQNWVAEEFRVPGAEWKVESVATTGS